MKNGSYHRVPGYYYDLRPELFNARGISFKQSANMVRALRKVLGETLSAKSITRNGLDNPLLSDDARQVLINEGLRDYKRRAASVDAMNAPRMARRTLGKAA